MVNRGNMNEKKRNLLPGECKSRQILIDQVVQLGRQRVAVFERRWAKSLMEQVMAALTAAGGTLAVDDDTPPELIRASFGVSKKAFKQALGALFKAKRIEFTKPGIRAVR